MRPAIERNEGIYVPCMYLIFLTNTSIDFRNAVIVPYFGLSYHSVSLYITNNYYH